MIELHELDLYNSSNASSLADLSPSQLALLTAKIYYIGLDDSLELALRINNLLMGIPLK